MLLSSHAQLALLVVLTLLSLTAKVLLSWGAWEEGDGRCEVERTTGRQEKEDLKKLKEAREQKQTAISILRAVSTIGSLTDQ